ncbi:hypothetical protein HPB47_013202 [Ixodes persulcatus]|uniref:Uncharacterized protein n=1 Tax=Ixodes persulcatus TaxID=34615 RepID=A0AC60R1T0_IXOPE|nr:hypothetical protein HPB47_013202 [Ixodes persulcatus]
MNGSIHDSYDVSISQPDFSSQGVSPCYGLRMTKIGLDITGFILSFAIMTVYLGISVFSSHETDPDPLLKQLPKQPSGGASSDAGRVVVRFGLAIASFLVVFVFGAGIVWAYRPNTKYLYLISAKGTIQNTCCRLFWCSSFITFDLELQVSMTIMVMDEGMMWSVVDILVIVGGLLILVVWAVVGFKAIYTERPMEAWNILRHAVLWCGVIAILTRLTVGISMCLVKRDFGKGVKEKLFDIDRSSDESDCYQEMLEAVHFDCDPLATSSSDGELRANSPWSPSSGNISQVQTGLKVNGPGARA